MWIPAVELVLAVLVASSAPDLEPGRKLRQEGKIQEAILFFQEVLASQPDPLDAERELGHCLVLAGRYAEAVAAYAKLAASDDPRRQLEAAKWTGLTHLYLGNIETALEQNRREKHLAEQLGERSAQVRATWYAGQVHTELGQFGAANTSFLAALDLSPDDLDALHLVGVLTARQGDWGSLRHQVQDLELAVARSGDPDPTGRVYHLKAELALGQGKPQEAQELLEKTSITNPLDQETMARAYRAQGDLPRAEATYGTILHFTDHRLDAPLYYMKALLGMAEVLDSQERGEEAASLYRRFLEHWGNAAGPLPGVAAARKRLEQLEGPP